MHVFTMATVFVVFTLVGVEFSVSAFIHPAAHRLEAEPQLTILRRLAVVLGKVMPVWYPVSSVLLIIQTWLYWQMPGRAVLLIADAIWILTALLSIVLLVPLNNRVADGDADWRRIHRVWDQRHRVRVAALAVGAVLLSDVVLR